MNKRFYGKPAPKKPPWPKGGPPPPLKRGPRPNRNQLCPCQSGKKFKQCCRTVENLISTLKTLIAEDEENADPDNT